MKFDIFHCRRYPAHPLHSEVDVFYSIKPKGIFTQSFKKDFNIISKNMIITSNNPVISKEIINVFKCKKQKTWITIPKHISNVVQMDMVVLMNTYCNCKTKEQYWELYYYTPTQRTATEFRNFLQYDENDSDEEDLSLKP